MLGILFFLKTVLLIQYRRIIVFRALHCSPLCGKRLFLQLKIADHPVKRSLGKRPDLPLSVHDHAQDAGHDSTNGDHCTISLQIILYSLTVF